MKILLTFSLILWTTTSFSQDLLFGRLYSLPFPDDLDNRKFVLRQMEISKNQIKEEYVGRFFEKLSEVDRVESEQQIDSVFQFDNHFYFIYQNKKKGFTYKEIVYDSSDKFRPVLIRDNTLSVSFYSKENLVEFVTYFYKNKSQDFTATYMPYYTKAGVLQFSKFKTIDKIDALSLKRILRKIIEQIKLEEEIIKAMSGQNKEFYNMSDRHGLSYFSFFVEAGYSPFISEKDLNNLEIKYSADKEIKYLFSQWVK